MNNDQYQITSQIDGATAMDGSALDSAPQLPQGTDPFTTAMLSATPGTATPGTGESTQDARAGAAIGGNGSGGINPFIAGLPIKLPAIPWPASMLWIVVTVGALFLYTEVRK
jgi:hypothetical protein